ncbi:MAG TPA: hypothetical protein VF331_11620 [Polyangiales bacterium]
MFVRHGAWAFIAFAAATLHGCVSNGGTPLDAGDKLDARSDAQARGVDAGAANDARAHADAAAHAQPLVDSGTRASQPDDAEVGLDSGSADSDAGRAGVRCLGAVADCVAGQVCCHAATAFTCEAPSACTGDALACDGTEDCPGALCCGAAGGTACAASCSGYHICHSAAECGSGESCCPNGGSIYGGGLMHCLALAAGTVCPLPP